MKVYKYIRTYIHTYSHANIISIYYTNVYLYIYAYTSKCLQLYYYILRAKIVIKYISMLTTNC